MPFAIRTRAVTATTPDSPATSAPDAAAEFALLVSPLELFFDLVFVFTITQLAGGLAHHLTVGGLLQVLAMLAVIWWMYDAFIWLTNAMPPSTHGRRGVLLPGTAVSALAQVAGAAAVLAATFGYEERRARRLSVPGDRLPEEQTGTNRVGSGPGVIIKDGLYRVRNVGSGLLLEVAEGSRRSGAKAQQGRDDGTPAQLWRLTAVHPGGALYHFENAASGKRLDVTGASTDNGVPVQQWSANAFGAQEWLLEQHVDTPGTFTLTSFISGKALEVTDAATTPGAAVRQWEDNDTAAQWWRLEPA